MGVMAGGAAYLYSRYGGAKALPFAVIGAVIVLAAIGGRQPISAVVAQHTSD